MKSKRIGTLPATLMCGLLAAFLGAMAVKYMAVPAIALTPEENMNQANANKADVGRLVQLTIDLDILEKYYHPEVPGRKPLCVVKTESMPDDLSLTKFGEPVRFIPASQREKAPAACLELSSIQIQGDTASVEFAYDAEGIRGEVSFRRTGGEWRVENRKLHEG